MTHPKNVIDYKCTDCKLYKERTQVVWGDGNPESKLVFVGEGPGREEDLEGRAFCGQAGQLLTNIIKFLKHKRDEFLFLNLVRCRPPNNRNPEIEEIKACDKHLRRQIQCCNNVKVLVGLGVVPWKGLTGINESVTKNHGRIIKSGKFKLLYAYHPSYLIRNPKNKDLKKQFIVDIRKAIKLARV